MSLLYPQAMAVQVYREEGNGLTATFEDDERDQEFEVFAVPYGGQQITTQRIKMDEPSGVYKEPHEILIDGVRGTAFFGNNAIMGDTYEVWLIHGGYLYEVMTYKELDTWLDGIMQTWQFI